MWQNKTGDFTYGQNPTALIFWFNFYGAQQNATYRTH